MASSQEGDADNPQQGNQKIGPTKLSEEETKVLKECENESFFRRALPLSCGAIIGVQYLVRTGKMARHPKFGALPKSTIAAGLAYLMGKISYLPECRKKILDRIPDSSLALTIKKGQGGPIQTMRSGHDSVMGQPSDDSNIRSAPPKEAPSYEGLSDSKRPSLDNEVKVPDAPEEKKTMTYDDLRQRNRQEYKDSLSTPGAPKEPGAPSYKDSPLMPQKPWPESRSPQQDSPDPPQAPQKRKRTNMWGDVIDE